VLQCDAVRCSAMQGVAVRCSVLQGVAVRCSVLQCVAVLQECVSQCGAVWCSLVQYVTEQLYNRYMARCQGVLQCLALSCSVLY